MAKELAELPKVVRAEAVGKPGYDEASKSIVLNIAVTVNDGAYADFVKRSTALLDKINVGKDSTLCSGVPHTGVPADSQRYSRELTEREGRVLVGPNRPADGQTWALWMLSSMDRQAVKIALARVSR